jgi:hypothetical protein
VVDHVSTDSLKDWLMEREADNNGSKSEVTKLENVDAFYRENGVVWGGLDIFFAPDNTRLRVLEFVKALSLHGENERPVQNWTIIVPSESIDAEQLTNEVLGALNEANSFSRESPNEPLVEVIETVSFSSDDVLRAVTARLKARAVFVVCSAYLFHSPEVMVANSETGSRISLSEEIWAPQVFSLAKRLAQLSATSDALVIVDVGTFAPARQELFMPFLEMENVAVCSGYAPNSIELVLNAAAPRWNEYLVEGRVGKVIQDIEQISGIPDSEKSFLRAQVFHNIGLSAQALAEIRSLLDVQTMNTFAIVRMARIAMKAGASGVAEKLLKRSCGALRSVADFETAWTVASGLDSNILREEIALLYAKRFPDSLELKKRRFWLALSRRDFVEARLALANAGDVEHQLKFLAYLEDWTGGEGSPNYAMAVSELVSMPPSLRQEGRLYLVRDAVRRGLFAHAFELVGGLLRPSGPIEPRLFLLVAEAMLLNADFAKSFPVEADRFVACFQEVIEYVARHPEDNTLKARLQYVLSSEVSARAGLAIMALVVLRKLEAGYSLREAPSAPSSDDKSNGSSDELKAFFRRAFSWLKSESPFVVGRLAIPTDLLPDDVDEALDAVSLLTREISDGSQEDFSFMEVTNWLAIAMSLAPHSSDAGRGIKILSDAAVRLAHTGKSQSARDLCQQILDSCTGKPEWLPSAWRTLADTYLRLHNLEEALLASTCCLSIGTAVTIEEAFSQTDVVTRVLRDAGQFEAARRAHQLTGELLRALDCSDASRIKHIHSALIIDSAEFLSRPTNDHAQWLAHIARVAEHAKAILEHNIEALPVAMQLGQLIRHARSIGVSVPVECNDLLENLIGRLDTQGRLLAEALALQSSDDSNLLKLHERSEGARFSFDSARDVRPVVLAARHRLSDPSISTTSAALALELTSDRAIPPPGWEMTSHPIAGLKSAESALQMLTRLSEQDMDVLMIGLDETDKPILLFAQSGNISAPARPPSSVFSVAEFNRWAKDYPFNYGIDGSVNNIFYLTTELLRAPVELSKRTLVITSTELQKFPVNLLRANDQFFAGELHPMASAPSLGWVDYARQNSAVTDGQSRAWISEANTNGSTLGFVRDRLQDTFDEYGVTLDLSRELPEGFWRSELVIVVAHGGIFAESGHFRKVSDEGNLTVSPSEFAQAFKNTGLVILFVCSGGRSDKHPMAETTVGLTKELLIHGCSAVIASPWPLDSQVPAHWLRAFLPLWLQGSTVIDANFIANETVAARFSSNFDKSLAMSVFGDPLRTARAQAN